MEKAELVRTLRESLAPDSENYLKAKARASDVPSDGAEALFMHIVAEPTKKALSRDEPFGNGAGFLVARDNGYSGFHAKEAAIALVRRVLRGDTPEQALAWLEKILATDQGTGIGILSLWGVKVESRIVLERGVTLLPFSSLPDSGTKAWLSRPRDPRSLPGFLGTMFASQPSAALICTLTVRPFIFSTKHGDPQKQKNPLALQSVLHEATLALTLLGPSCPLSAGYWFQFDDRDLAEASFYGGVRSSYQEVLPWGFEPPVVLDPTDTQRVVNAFLTLADPLRAKIRLGLGRLNQAVRRPPTGDRALDLSIALETVLAVGAGENTYKVGLRAALLLDVPPEQKIRARAIIGALYSVRSALVHNGVLPSEVKVVGLGKRSSAEVVKEATDICAAVLRAIVESGSIPNWYQYELTGRRQSD